jgi:hypothetical protein
MSASAAGSVPAIGTWVRRKIVRVSCAVLATILLFVRTRETIMYRDHDTEASF